MSRSQKDRKLRSNTEKPFPETSTEGFDFTTAIAQALRRQYGHSPAAVKTVVRLTRTNPRAVRNWFAANNGPNGENLVELVRHSEEVLETVLQLAGRHDLVTARKLAGAREKLREMLEMIDELQSSQT
ncbi:hypothetical protein DMC25_00090 [Caulobacter sp. D4A]|uniref:hypothetical protein n=1 Tax=unclassified Caulobacter TaxID=2648921 RepID=UPI000D7288CE|nr:MULTISPECIES: hypothetical protein [unclassified Caulobacter]PXA93486.1 hypothetical protein DMC18_08795 [Caulobacter sp. D5]PXA95752.1 hypothetical protein DMC25_00090 [Caulobacter sp. D4A]